MTTPTYDGPLTGALGALQRRIVACDACPRLVEHRRRVAVTPPARHRGSAYWAAPVPGNGDPHARLLIVGLAPASHGSNRTARMFTGDPSADFLTAALHRAGFASQPASRHRDGGLTLRGAFVTAAGRCAPPQDKPTPAELAACRPFLAEELRLLTKVRVVLALGRIAFDGYLRAVRQATGVDGIGRGLAFGHGVNHLLGEGLPALCCSYHPSPRNTNTGRLTASSLDAVLAAVRARLDA
ncbi:MAG: uracil-DNA glycosylase [SAR202 cluster bacterium]|nr:uracil-DNA glycosylase [SAR202 cluster bacterium]